MVWRLHIIAGVLGLDRPRAGLGLGERVTLAANLLDEAGKVIAPATGVEWATDRPEVAVVSGGEVRAISPGRAVVTATLPGGKPATADIFVTADLLVASNRSGAFGIYQLRPDSPDTLLPVLVDSGANVQAVRSPDRTRIAFSSNRAGSYDLYVMDADGRDVRRLTVDAGSEGDPVWTPDGSRILYTAAPPAGTPQVMSIRPDGGDARPIAVSTGGNRGAGRLAGRAAGRVRLHPGRQSGDLRGRHRRRRGAAPHQERRPREQPALSPERRPDLRPREGQQGAGDAIVRREPPRRSPCSRSTSRSSRWTSRATASASPTWRGSSPRRGRGSRSSTLRIQPLGAGSTPLLVPLRPGEQVLSPSF